MKKVFAAIFIVLVGLAAFYLNHQKTVKNRGTVILWQPVEFTYKDYTGSPGIDEPEFYEIVKQKNAAGNCNVYYTNYSNTPIEEVRKYIDTDTDAMFEIYARGINDHQLIEPQNVSYDDADYLLEKAAQLGHIQAKLIVAVHGLAHGDYEKDEVFDLLDKYEKVTPVAVFEKMLLLFNFYNADYSEEVLKLKNAGQYYYMLEYVASWEIVQMGITDNDLFCEAYFNGCDLYKYKIRENIICESLK